MIAGSLFSEWYMMTIETKFKMCKAEVWYKVLENHFECNDMWMKPHNSLY